MRSAQRRPGAGAARAPADLAAVEAGVRVPVAVMGDESAGTAGEVERITGQYAENAHRPGLTVTETAGVVRQLQDLGLTAGQIQRRTKIPKADIAAADTVTRSAAPSEAAGEYPLTLGQAAVLAEFDDDPDAVQALLVAAPKERSGSTMRRSTSATPATSASRSPTSAASLRPPG